MIELGVTASDIVTGFEGVVTGRAQYLTGCDQYVLTPKSKDGAAATGQWFDENRLKFTKGTKKVVLPTLDNGKTGGPATGTPARSDRPRKARPRRT